MFTDVSLCIGCRACQVACKQWNQLEPEEPEWTGSYQNHEHFTDKTFRLVRFIEEPATTRSSMRWHMMSDVCKHCAQAGCLEACPTGAIYRTEYGTVNINQDICNGCRYCISACPFGVVSFNHDTGTATKCTFCNDRLHNGLGPACAKACPTQSITFGYPRRAGSEGEAARRRAAENGRVRRAVVRRRSERPAGRPQRVLPAAGLAREVRVAGAAEAAAAQRRPRLDLLHRRRRRRRASARCSRSVARRHGDEGSGRRTPSRPTAETYRGAGHGTGTSQERRLAAPHRHLLLPGWHGRRRVRDRHDRQPASTAAAIGTSSGSATTWRCLAIIPCPILLIVDLGLPIAVPEHVDGVQAVARDRHERGDRWPVAPQAVLSDERGRLGRCMVFSPARSSVRLETWLADRARPRLPARAAHVAGVIGSVVGFFLAAYPGVLLGATARPLFISAHWLGALFLAVGAATGSAAIALVLVWLRGSAAQRRAGACHAGHVGRAGRGDGRAGAGDRVGQGGRIGRHRRGAGTAC